MVTEVVISCVAFIFIIISIDLSYNLPNVLLLVLVRCLLYCPILAETHPVTSYGSFREVAVEFLEI